MSLAEGAPSSSFAQVPLLLTPELRDSVLSSAAEVVVEHGARNRCFLHIHSEEERRAALKMPTASDDIVRRAHERWLEELRWARAVLWEDPRIRRFVRHPNHLVWPAHEHLRKVTAVVRQLLLCATENTAAALEKANALARAAQIVEREATQPGLHQLQESVLPGQAVLYQVEQTRKRERDAAAPSMPSVLSRVAAAPVEQTAWIAELKQVSYAVPDLLQLQYGAAPLQRLVDLVRPPSTDAAAVSSPATPAAVRQAWRTLVEHHRACAEYASLFADVAETCLSWRASEAFVAAAAGAAVEDGHSVQLRTGVHATVVHRREHVLLLCPATRPLESFTAAEQSAVASAAGNSSWAQLTEEGRLSVVPAPSGAATAASLESVIRQRFLSPALRGLALRDCCTMDAPVDLPHGSLQVVRLSAAFNPFVVLHGSRVENGFQGDVTYHQTLQRDRDRLVEERTDEQLRRGDAETPARGTTTTAATAAVNTAGAAASKRSTTTAAPLTPATTYIFTRTLISVLSAAPLTKAEIQQHPSMQQFKSAGTLDALLNAKLKDIAEAKGRKYQLRS